MYLQLRRSTVRDYDADPLTYHSRSAAVRVIDEQALRCLLIDYFSLRRRFDVVKTKFTLTSAAEADKVRDWFKSGRGVYRWTSKDLSMARGDMITPGDVTAAPHWAYVGHPEKAEPEDFEIVTRTKVDLVPEWYPDCKYCDGSGCRSVKSVALIRKEKASLTREMLQNDGRSVWVDKNNIQCWSCRGTGAEITPPTFRVKRLPPYKGGGWQVSNAGKAACNDLCVKLANHYKLGEHNNAPKAIRGQLGSEFVKWDWEGREYGMGQAYFFTEKTTPLEIS